MLDNITDETKRATNNIPKTDVVQANYLNVYNVLNADTIVITKKSLEVVDGWLGNKEAKS